MQAFYARYPYPTGLPLDGEGLGVRQLLGEFHPHWRQGGTPQVLEAGCGCGLGLIEAARRQSDCQFTGVDINPRAIERASQRAGSLGLRNIRFRQADLLQPRTLEPPPGGYQLIYSFGVLHHLASPALGLRNLARLLARGGLVCAMLYGRLGRQPLQRLRQAIALAVDPDLPIEQRIGPARRLAELADRSLLRHSCWRGTYRVEEVEFVDRCLHVHEQSYDIDGLWRLLEAGGMHFLRWLRPADWSLDRLPPDPATRQLLAGLSELDRYRLIERLCERPRLELLMMRDDLSREGA